MSGFSCQVKYNKKTNEDRGKCGYFIWEFTQQFKHLNYLILYRLKQNLHFGKNFA